MIEGGGESPLVVTVTYNATFSSSDGAATSAELTFQDVLELRWIEWDVEYESHARHDDDYEFAVIEIVDSAYIEAMVASVSAKNLQSRGPSCRHFRIGVDDWGKLDIIASDVVVRTVTRH